MRNDPRQPRLELLVDSLFHDVSGIRAHVRWSDGAVDELQQSGNNFVVPLSPDWNVRMNADALLELASEFRTTNVEWASLGFTRGDVVTRRHNEAMVPRLTKFWQTLLGFEAWRCTT
jgi:hypothetical protein